MLMITSGQQAALVAANGLGFDGQLVATLTASYPEQARDRDGVVAVVTVAAADARRMGLSEPYAVGLYVLAAFLIGISIKDDARIHAAIRDSLASETAKSIWLEQWLTAIGVSLDVT